MRDVDDSYAKSACGGVDMLRAQKLNNAPSDSLVLQNGVKTPYFTMSYEGAVRMRRGGRVRPGQNRMSREIPQETGGRQKGDKILDGLSPIFYAFYIVKLHLLARGDRETTKKVLAQGDPARPGSGFQEKVLAKILYPCLPGPKNAIS